MFYYSADASECFCRPWQESKKGTGSSPNFDFEVFDIPVENVNQDKLQLIVW